MPSRRVLVPGVVLATVLVGGVLAAQAAPPYMTPGHRLDGIVDLYHDRAASWQSVLETYAIRLFWLLAMIEFAWAAITLAFRGADFGDWAASLVNQVLFIGFFYTLLLNSSAWSGAIVNSFRAAADAASVAAGGTGAVSPSNIFDVGLNLARKVYEQVTIMHPGDSVGLVIAAIVILVCFGLISAFLIVALVESYIVVSAGVLLMGFGGSRWTKDYALRVIVFAVSVGAKLFVLQLLVGLGEAMIQGWVDAFGTDSTDLFLMIGASIVFLALVKLIPDLVQGLISGSSMAHGSALSGTVMAGAAVGAGVAASVATGMIGAGLATAGAAQLASAQLASSAAAGTAPTSRIGRIAALTGGTVRNLGSAAAQDLGYRLGGRAHWGTMPGRMAMSLSERAQAMRADLNKPRPPEAGPDGPANTIGPA